MITGYLKAWVMVIGTVLSAVSLALVDGGVGLEDTIKIALAGVGALVVFATPEYGGYGRAAKFVVAAGTAALTFLLSAVTDGFTLAEIIQAVVVALAAVGVGVVSNAEPSE